jgi:hypothetical protein
LNNVLTLKILEEKGEIRITKGFSFFLTIFPLDWSDPAQKVRYIFKTLFCAGYRIGLECQNQLFEHTEKPAPSTRQKNHQSQFGDGGGVATAG